MWRRRLQTGAPSGDRATFLSSAQQLRDASQGGASAAKDVILDALVEAGGIVLPSTSISSDDCATMLVSIASCVGTNDVVLRSRACELMDRIVRSQEVALQSRQLDVIVPFLLKCAAVGGSAASSSASPSPATPLTATATAIDRGVAATALRCLGCVLYENAERCSKWYNAVFTALQPFLTQLPTAAAAAAAAAAASAAAAPVVASPAALVTSPGGPGLVASPPGHISSGRSVGSHTSAAAAAALLSSHPDDPLHTALVCAGNLLLKAGRAVRDTHGRLLHQLLRILNFGSALPAKTVGEVEYSGRILSPALRALLCVLQTGEAEVKESFTVIGADMLRVLHDLSTFGWKCDALVRKKRPGRRSTGGAGAGAGAGGGANRTPARNRSSLGGAAARAAANTAVERDRISEVSEADDTGTGEHSDHGSVASGSTRSRSRWHVAAMAGGHAPAAIRSGSSWYTDSDSDDGDEASEDGWGGGGVGGGGGGGAASRLRRIPVRVRVTALHCVTAIAKHSPKLVHSRWETFIPQVQGTHPKPYAPSLLTVLLYDSSHRVQEAAASALAAIVDGAPLDKWIALPPVHDAAAALSRHAPATAAATTTASAGGGAGAEGGVPTRSPTGGRAHGSTTSSASASASSSHSLKRAFNSLSDKTTAMLLELHAALIKALGSTDPSRYPALVTQLLKCAGMVVAITPYDRLPATMPAAAASAGTGKDSGSSATGTSSSSTAGAARSINGELCDLAVSLLHSTAQPVSVAALQVIASAFSNPVAVNAGDVPTPGPAAAATTAAAAASPSPAPQSPPPSRAARMLRALISHSGKGTSPVIKSEILGVLSKAARHHAGLVAGCWSQLAPLVLDCCADAAPQVRATALKLIEEMLHSRATALSHSAGSSEDGGMMGGGDDEDGDGGGGSGGGRRRGQAASSSSATSGAAHTQSHAGAADGVNPLDGPVWAQLEGTAPGAPCAVTIKSLLCTFLRAGLRDIAPTVRSAAAMCMSYLLPTDWITALGLPALDPSAAASVSGGEGDGGVPATTAAAASAVSAAPAPSPAAAAAALSTRDDILHLLATVSFDPVPTVRVSVARVWGAYLAFPEWKTRAFASLSARILLVLLADDNVGVRAKASWALGNLTAPLSASPAQAAALVAAVTKRHRGAASSTLALPFPESLGAAASSARGPPVYPALGETTVPEVPAWLPPQCKTLQPALDAASADEPGSSNTGAGSSGSSGPGSTGGSGSGSGGGAGSGSTDSMASAPPVAPMAMFLPGLSQAALVNLLGLPLTRVLTQAVLRASADTDKVSCTAVRSLGYCVQALVYHWLPLPSDMREMVNPIVRIAVPASGRGSSEGDASAAVSASSLQHMQTSLPVRRAAPKPCPDDALIKSAMLMLADIVAGTQGTPASALATANAAATSTVPARGGGGRGGGGGGGGGGAAASSAAAPTAAAAPVPPAPSRDAGPQHAPKSRTLPSQMWQDVGEEEDVREVIARRLQGRAAAAAAVSVSAAAAAQQAQEAADAAEGNAGDDDADGEGGTTTATATATATAGGDEDGTAKKRPSPPATVAGTGAAASPSQTAGPQQQQQRSKFGGARWASKARSSEAAESGNWRDGGARSTGADGAAASGAVSSPGGPAAVTAGSGHGQSGPGSAAYTSSSSSGPAVKVRWNACHAVSQIMPLTHRIVMTHGPDSKESSTDTSAASASTGGAGVDADGDTDAGATATVGGGSSSNSSSNNAASSIAVSPPRPKVRKDVHSGTATMWAGVDHVSTAMTPFAPKALTLAMQQQAMVQQQAVAAAAAATAQQEGGTGGTGSSTPGPHTPSRPTGAAAAAQAASTNASGNATPAAAPHDVTAAPTSTTTGSSNSSAVRLIVTDPTLPSVALGATWVPPILAALQIALTSCNNFKVRIAAAQALGSVPSRQSYRIPSAAGFAPDMGASSTSASGSQADGGNGGALAHLSPLLQRPGYDAYPPAFMGLLQALEASEAASDFTEYRYKEQLKGVIRVALLATIALAERMDYGRMKAFLDEKAELLYEWLCAEDSLSAPPGVSSGGGGGTPGGLPAAMLPPATASATAAASTVGVGLVAAAPVPAPRPAAVNIDDMPVRGARQPALGILQPHPSIEAAQVRTAFRTLTALFASRYKTIPKDLLKKFQDKVQP